MEQQKGTGKPQKRNWKRKGGMKGRQRRRGMERGSESHCNLVRFQKKRGGGGLETGNQLFGRFDPALLVARMNLELSLIHI